MKIPGYPKYSIDRTGLVRGKRGRLKTSIGFQGHPTVTLYGENSKRKKLFVYLIVAEAFLGYRPGTGDVIRFKDNDYTNVHASNLELTSRRVIAQETRVSDLPPGIVRVGDLFRVDLWVDEKKKSFGPYGSLRRAILKKKQHEERFNL